MVFVVIKIITQELEIESNLKQRLEFICELKVKMLTAKTMHQVEVLSLT